ncbi:MAG TPA: cytochrome P450 [Thermoleophilaceae bacterium]|nr:cytochrome P450 [Thermoleophilaceae bacterium]
MAKLPPGPRAPRAVQTLAWWTRSVPLFERCRARYGKRFTLRLLQTPPFVHLSDPAEVKEVFTASPDVLHPGEGARILEPVVGANSVILLDESAHLSQRKLMLPAFHGARMEALTGLLEEVTEREVASWPLGEPFELHPRLQALTLEVILRAVFGLDEGERLDILRERLTQILEFGSHPASMLPVLQRGRVWNEFVRGREEVDRLLFNLVDERRAAADGEAREDVLSMLLAARHEDGSPMSKVELRDELMTLLVAGHETTASELSWAFERLARTPRVVRELQAAVDSADGDAYVTATAQETLRHRPVLPQAAPRLVKQPVEIGGFRYPEGVCLAANSYLIHHDPAIYPDPYEFRPERFLDEPPGTYTWIPFGGGRRRCLGASFAMLEMKVVLRAVFARAEPMPAPTPLEGSRRRSITLSPRRGATTMLRARTREPAYAPALGA